MNISNTKKKSSIKKASFSDRHRSSMLKFNILRAFSLLFLSSIKRNLSLVKKRQIKDSYTVEKSEIFQKNKDFNSTQISSAKKLNT
jgi:hypothetical protein